ncbi:MAG: twin-arginine translocase subunit TatC [Dehalococcoidales bacterium]|nr:twin-arginine translocase subunit TatC [Dehalococcoidales bacterium]
MTDGKLTVLGHLNELRKRLIRIAIALAITTMISFAFWERLFGILIRPAQNTEFVYIELTEMLGTMMQVCLASGIVLAAPYVILQIVLFIAPALTSREKKYLYIALPFIGIMFAGGVVFGYFVLIPPAVNFLISLGSNVVTPQIRIGNYISLITRILLAIGLVFELPVLTTILARIGIVKARWLAGKRRVALLGSFILAAIITPTFDPFNQLLVAIPLIVLYELSIWLAKLFERRDVPVTETALTPDSGR